MKTRFITGIIGFGMLCACLEPQPKPELPKQATSDFTVTTLAQNLSNPWSVAELPDGRFLITEKSGRLLLIDGNERSELSGVPTVYDKGQGGLLDVVPAPDFQTSREIYLSYAHGTPQENGTALLRANLGETGLIDPVVIFEASPLKSAHSHYGGRIVFMPEGDLVLTLGDGFHLREEAQNRKSNLGKVMRMNRDGSNARIYSLGHRNVQGAHYDKGSQSFWTHEHGPRGGDELNLMKEGQNYGWPIATTGLDYNGAKISPFKSYEGMTDPVHQWTPSIAPSGMTIYRGELFDDWNGDALVGGLASRDVRHLEIENGKVIAETILFHDLKSSPDNEGGQRIRDVRTARDGSLLILTDDPETGMLLKITP